MPSCCLVVKLCLILCSPVDCSLPGSSVCGVFQAIILDRVVISFSGISSQPGIEPISPSLACKFFTTEPPGKPNASNALRKPRRPMNFIPQEAPENPQSVQTREVICCSGFAKSWVQIPSLHGKQMGKQWQSLFTGAPKSLQMVTAAMKLKDAYSLEIKVMSN